MNIEFRSRQIPLLILRLAAISILLATGNLIVYSQESALDQPVTIRMSDVKISAVLKSITRKTGYSFTYDTDLVKPEEITSVAVQNLQVRKVLDQIFTGRSFRYSLLDNHIIIYRAITENTPTIEEAGKDPVYSISGLITDEETGETLPYATIGIKRKGIGTISNSEGEFTLKITADCLDDTLSISYLGYSKRTIPVNQAIETNFNIGLKYEYVSIPEVIIRTREPIELIRNAVTNIAENYGTTPSKLTAFYRESVRKKDKLHLYSEAVLDIYKSPYSRTIQTDQICVFKSRKTVNIDITDTLTIKLRAGLNSSLRLDGMKYLFDFIVEENLQDYDYRMVDIVNIGDEAAYAVEFEQKEYVTDMPLFKGVIYINTDNFGVHSAEFEIHPDYIDKIDPNFVQQSPAGFGIDVREIKYTVNYSFFNGRFYLNHVRGDIELHARKRRKLFGSIYDLFFELAVTKIDTVNVERFPREVVSPTHTVFSEMINEYDPEFWGTDNFLDPEADLKEALTRINIRLGKYRKSNQ
ncbi:MAG TPA: carboxypeptidase-like regulatory domain-containing protein [Bacteroidales bacterium]|nr:carboxypeptidase-like regulatory domain-containing protein [Bacteroidales bacterium]